MNMKNMKDFKGEYLGQLVGQNVSITHLGS